MIEVERKRKLEDREKLIERLQLLGFYAGKTVLETDVYYSRGDVDYMKTVECLRVRRKDDNFAEITYKPPTIPAGQFSNGIIAKKESNVRLANIDQVEQAEILLKNIGMIELARVIKKRTSFNASHYPDVTVALDDVHGVGCFVETEILTENSEQAGHYLKSVEEVIGVSEYDIVTEPYRDLVIKAYGEHLDG